MRSAEKKKVEARKRRKMRVRGKISGTPERPRLSVFRSSKHISAQLIDDLAGKTIVSSDDAKLKAADIKKVDGADAKVAKAYVVGAILAEKAKKAGIVKVVFDRSGYTYHGRVKALADGARAGGLEF